MSRRAHAALALALCALLALGCAPRPRPQPRPEPEPPRRRVETRVPPLTLTLDLPAGTLEADTGYRASATIANESAQPVTRRGAPLLIELLDSDGERVWSDFPLLEQPPPTMSAPQTLQPNASRTGTFTLTLPEAGRYTLVASWAGGSADPGIKTPAVPLVAKAP